MNNVVTIRGLDHRYGATHALRGVDLTVAAGECVALLGPNGAGKTTLVNAIARLLPIRRGKLTFGGTDMTGASAQDMCNRGVALIPEGRRLFTRMTVVENLELGSYRRAARAAKAAALERVYAMFPILAELRAQLAGTMSGGQQQMLAIARALLARPAVILMDEPSLGLSPKLTAEIFEIVRRINRERGATILLVEQNAHMALKIADYGYVLEVGRIVMEDTGERLAQKPDIQEFYLGMKASGVRGERRWKKKKLWR